MELPIQSVGGGLPGLMSQTVATPHGKGNELEGAVYDFVGLLYGYAFSQMRASSAADEDEEGSLFGGASSQMFMGFLDQEVGSKIARAEGSGLAQQMLWQMPGGGKKA